MNVLIVDDEPIVRLGLSTLIDWDRHGLTLAGTASDGLEAWQAVQSGDVDIVVTDILMPRMDGLELVRRLKQAAADVAVVMLSCLDDFAYVKEAMKLGARDYILKPTMEPEGLLAVLLEVKDALARQRDEQAQLAKWRTELQQSKQAQLGARLERWLASGQPDDELESLLLPEGKRLFSIGLRAGGGIPGGADWRCPGVHAAIRCGDQAALLLLAIEPHVSQQELNAACYAKTVELHRYAVREAGLDEGRLIVAPGMHVRSLGHVQAAARLLDRQLHRYFYERTAPAFGDTAGEVTALPTRLPQEEKIDVLRAVSAGNPEAALDALERIGAALKESRPPAAKVYPFVLELLSLAAGYARERGAQRIDELEETYARSEAVRSFLELDELLRFTAEAVRALAGMSPKAAAGLQSKNPFIRKAVQYMREHYRENIGTSDIAEHVRLSRSYLSDLYGKEMGESLSESLTRIRLGEAKRLLATGEKKVYEVAEAVGFQDAKTFAKTFKKYVGCSPKEFEA